MPVRPQRVVALDFMFAESVIALDLVPVGMADTAFYPGWLGYQSERLANVTDIGSRQEPGLEAIAAVKPDLIIGVGFAMRRSSTRSTGSHRRSCSSSARMCPMAACRSRSSTGCGRSSGRSVR